jgi:Protein of unknown function (DUF3168)
MSDPSLELQAAVVTALKANAGVVAVVGSRVYDNVPPSATFPYISLGDSQVLPDKADCIDGTEIFFNLDGWSRDTRFPECKTISKAVVAALDDQPLTVTGYTAVVFELDNINYLRDPDGITRHVALSFRALVQST